MEEQIQNKEQSTQDINELLKVRRTKLSDLVEKGKNPFVITKFDVTAHSDEIKNNLDNGMDPPIFKA